MADSLPDPETILTQALVIATPRERREFVIRACGGNKLLCASIMKRLEDGDATRSLQSSETASVAQDWSLLDPEQTTAGAMEVRNWHLGLPKVAGFEMLDVLGRGGMGVVFKTRQLNLKRLVALKMILATQADEEGLLRFRSEAEAAARLQHPNIVQIYEVGEHDGQPYMALEFIDGGTLSEYLAMSPPSTREAAEIIETLARAMHYAHSQGIVHRDLKPGNVLISSVSSASQRDASKSHGRLSEIRSSSSNSTVRAKGQLVPKITDFGLAKHLDVDSEFTRTGAILGTPNYMAPEQAAANRQIGPAADIYSLGAMLYALIARQPPFVGNTPMETMQLVLTADPVAPRKLQSRIDKDLETICLKCLEKKPANRYESAAALADDLRRYLDGEAILARPASVAYRVTKLAIRHRNAAMVIGAAIVTLVTGLIVGNWYSSSVHKHTKDVLSDTKLLAELKVEHPGLLGVAFSARREAMESWLERATGLVQRLAAYRTMLETTRKQGQRVESPNESEEKWQFDSPTQQQLYDHSRQLIHGIVALSAQGGMLDRVKSWAPLAPFPSDIESRWESACQALAASHGIQLGRNEGLFPLGPDPQSQLWEFVDVRYGLAPKFVDDDRRRLAVGPETGFVYVLLPGGRFRMGSPENEVGRKESGFGNEQQHDVEIGPFFISKFEVTQAQWERVIGQNPSEHLGQLRAVHAVSWIDCERFCRDIGSSLPTEAQWEYACRAGTTGAFNVATSPDNLGWYAENSFDAVHIVGEKVPNSFGIYDMHGNVLEWCQDAFAADFYLRPEASQRNPINANDADGSELRRVLRGGSFEGKVSYMRSADRYAEKPERRWRGFGVRPVRQVSIPSGP